MSGTSNVGKKFQESSIWTKNSLVGNNERYLEQ